MWTTTKKNRSVYDQIKEHTDKIINMEAASTYVQLTSPSRLFKILFLPLFFILPTLVLVITLIAHIAVLPYVLLRLAANSFKTMRWKITRK